MVQYCPIALYLGTRGYCLELDLRPGSQHSACESEYNIERALAMACAVAKAPLLLRADSGFCSQHLISRTLEQAASLGPRVDLLIKWNLRTAPVEQIAAQHCADTSTQWSVLREGKRECLWSQALDAVEVPVGGPRSLRRLYRLTERSLDKKGQPLLLPEYLLEGWTTTLGPEADHEQQVHRQRRQCAHQVVGSELARGQTVQVHVGLELGMELLVRGVVAVQRNQLLVVRLRPQRHFGEDHVILDARHALYQQARQKNPARWSGQTRNWTPVDAVTLNPERDSVIKAAVAHAPIHAAAA